MPFAATWIQQEIIMLSEVNQKEKDEFHMNLKYDTKETIYKTETDSQTQRTGLEFGKRKRRERDGLGVWGSR